VSQKLPINRSDDKGAAPESLVNNTESYNRYSSSSTDSASELDSDSPARVVGGLSDAIIARFWGKVDKHGPVPIARPDLGSCWLWTGSRRAGRGECHYGQFILPRWNGKQRNVYAHRLAYELTFGPLPAGTPCVCHRCDRPNCVNPAHLFLGTQLDNLTDARRKGRLIDGLHVRKISDEAVADIRANYRRRVNGKQLAARHGITLTHLLRIVRGDSRPVVTPDRAAHVVLEPVAFRQLDVRGEVA